LQEGGGSEPREGNPPPQYVSVTQEEKEAIDRVILEIINKYKYLF
jgi:hypothetical protein